MLYLRTIMVNMDMQGSISKGVFCEHFVVDEESRGCVPLHLSANRASRLHVGQTGNLKVQIFVV